MRRTLILISLTLIDCGRQVSSPVPQPVPFAIRQSTPSPVQPSKLVIGLPGAVAGEGSVHVRIVGRPASEVIVPSTATGSFCATLTAAAEDSIEVQFETAAGLSETLVLPVARGGGPLLQGNKGPLDVVSAPDEHGLVTVTNNPGTAQQPPIDATPNVQLLLSDSASGEVVTSTTDAGGLFTVQIAAKTGDQLQLMLVEPESSATSDFLSLQVP